MAESSNRLTRSSVARFARLTHNEREASGEPSSRMQLGSEKGQSKWPAAFLDFNISKRIASQSPKDSSVGDMAPGVISKKLKTRYVANQTTRNVVPNSTPRRSSARLEQDVVKDSSTPIVNTPIRPKIVNKVARPQTTVPRTESPTGQTKSTPSQTKSTTRQTNSSTRQTNSTTRENNSTSGQTQISSPHTQSPISQTHSNVPQTEQNENEAAGPETELTDISEDENAEDDAETVVVSTKKTGTRGPTVGRGLMKGLGGSPAKKMKIEVDPLIGRPKNRVQSSKFSSQIGVVARDVLPPVRKWKELNVESGLEPCIEHLQMYLDVDMKKAGVKESVIDRLKGSSRQQRYRQHKHYLKYPTMEEAQKHPPKHLSGKQDEWNLLCEFFNSPEFKNRSEANTKNRKKVRAPHVTGRTPFSTIQNEFNGKEEENFELYLKTHKSDQKGWSSEDAELNYEMMLSNEAEYEEEGTEITEQEMVTEVLGKGNGYVKGYGYGPKPPGKSESSIHLQKLLDETREQLAEKSSEAESFKIMVGNLTDQVNDQAHQIKENAASLAKVMAFIQAGGQNADNGRDG